MTNILGRKLTGDLIERVYGLDGRKTLTMLLNGYLNDSQ